MRPDAERADFGSISLAQPLGWVPQGTPQAQLTLYPTFFTPNTTPVHLSVVVEAKKDIGVANAEETARRKFGRVSTRFPDSVLQRLDDAACKDGKRASVYLLRNTRFIAMLGIVENGDAVATFALDATDNEWFREGKRNLLAMIGSFEWKR